jgi:hypothetical protein
VDGGKRREEGVGVGLDLENLDKSALLSQTSKGNLSSLSPLSLSLSLSLLALSLSLSLSSQFSQLCLLPLTSVV